jgi:hypothetical protein
MVMVVRLVAVLVAWMMFSVFLPGVVMMVVMLSCAIVVPVVVRSSRDGFRNHDVARMVHMSVVSMALRLFALELLPPGSLPEAVATITSKLAYGMAFAFTVLEIPVFLTLPLVGDGYGSECRSEKRRSETHIERNEREPM